MHTLKAWTHSQKAHRHANTALKEKLSHTGVQTFIVILFPSEFWGQVHFVHYVQYIMCVYIYFIFLMYNFN